MPGDHALRYVSASGHYMAVYPGKIGIVVEAGPDSPVQIRQAATFTVVCGLSDPACYSLRTTTASTCGTAASREPG